MTFTCGMVKAKSASRHHSVHQGIYCWLASGVRSSSTSACGMKLAFDRRPAWGIASPWPREWAHVENADESGSGHLSIRYCRASNIFTFDVSCSGAMVFGKADKTWLLAKISCVMRACDIFQDFYFFDWLWWRHQEKAKAVLCFVKHQISSYSRRIHCESLGWCQDADAAHTAFIWHFIGLNMISR